MSLVAVFDPDGDSDLESVIDRGRASAVHRHDWASETDVEGRFALAGGPGQVHRREAVIAAAVARFDHRELLASRLGLTGSAHDAHIVATAYLAWGEGFAEHLEGDFLCVVWDGESRSMLMARDRLGVVPAYLAHRSRTRVVSDQINPVLASGIAPGSLDSRHVSRLMLGLHPDATSTAFVDVERHPPATTVRFDAAGARAHRYWSLSSSVGTESPHPEEAVGRLGELMAAAVDSRLAGSSQPGSQLSGGLDSSVVSALAARTNPSTLLVSNVFPVSSASDEKVFMEPVVRHLGLAQHMLDADRFSPVEAMERVASTWAAPVTAPNHHLVLGLCEAAAGIGVDRFLDGFDGDTVVSHGIGRLGELARAGRFDQLANEVAQYATHVGVSSDRVARELLSPVAVGLLKSGSRGLAARMVLSMRSAAGVRASIGPRALWGSASQAKWHYPTTFVRHETALAHGHIDLMRQLHHDRQTVGTDAEEQRGTLEGGLLPFALEMLAHHGTHAGVYLVHPFLDVRVVEFLLGLSSEHKLRDGWSRRILRDLASDLLPAESAWRLTKTSMSAAFHHALLRTDRDRITRIVSDQIGRLGDLVDPAVVQSATKRLVNEPVVNRSETLALWPLVATLTWMTARDLSV